MSKKSALLIGINVYPYLKDSDQLKGCLNDVFAIRAVLEQKFEFPSENVQTLLDKEATRSRILEAMKSLVDNCEPDDSVVFSFCGHGSRIATRKDHKPSGWYETIMPFDSGRQPLGPNIDITDDEIYEWLMALSEKTSNIVLIFDSCYAGSIVRTDEVEPGTTRGLPADEDTFISEAPAPIFSHSQAIAKENKGSERGPSGWLPLSDKYVLFAACAEHERAHMLNDPNSDEVVEHGALTYFLCQALWEAKSGDTYRDIWDQVYLNIKNRFEKQNAQLEGNRDRELFGLREFPPCRFLLISDQQNDRLTLSGGLLHGVTPNSRWIVYPPGTKYPGPDTNALGIIKVISVQTSLSEAVSVENSVAKVFETGSRAVQISGGQRKSRLKIWIDPASPGLEKQFNQLRQRLRQSPLLTITTKKELADASIQLSRGWTKQAHISLDRQTGNIHEPVWTVYGRDKVLLMSPQTSTEIVVDNLERFCRYRRLLELRNPNSAMMGKIDFIILKQNYDSSWSEIEPTGVEQKLLIHESERIAIKIVNRFESPIFFSLLDLGLTKRISLLYPSPGRKAIIGPLGNRPVKLDSEAQGKGILTLGIAENEWFNLSFPPEFPFAESVSRNNILPDEGLEIFKLIVTTYPHDLSFLRQGDMRTIFMHENPFEDLIIDTLRGNENFDKDPLYESENEWFAVNKIFFLKRN